MTVPVRTSSRIPGCREPGVPTDREWGEEEDDCENWTSNRTLTITPFHTSFICSWWAVSMGNDYLPPTPLATSHAIRAAARTRFSSWSAKVPLDPLPSSPDQKHSSFLERGFLCWNKAQEVCFGTKRSALKEQRLRVWEVPTCNLSEQGHRKISDLLF